jgi:hypothetical protein
MTKQTNSTTSSSEIEIPSHLSEEWESYLAVCESLDFKPNPARFIRYNELYPYK